MSAYKVSASSVVPDVYTQPHANVYLQEYMAPEIITQKGHDHAVDWWAFGVLVFELVGSPDPTLSSLLVFSIGPS